MLTAARPRPGSRTTLLALVSAVGALLVLALAVSAGPSPIDVADPALVALGGTEPAASVVDVANLAGSLPIWIALVVVLVTVLARTSLAKASELAFFAVLTEMSSASLKVLIGRPRPDSADVTDLLVTSGFPSGHVTRTAVLAGALLVLVPWCARHSRVAIGAGLVAVGVMAIARVSAQAHHTSDVLGALLLAASLLALWEVWRALGTSTPGSRPTSDPPAVAVPRQDQSAGHLRFTAKRNGAI